MSLIGKCHLVAIKCRRPHICAPDLDFIYREQVEAAIEKCLVCASRGEARDVPTAYSNFLAVKNQNQQQGQQKQQGPKHEQGQKQQQGKQEQKKDQKQQKQQPQQQEKKQPQPQQGPPDCPQHAKTPSEICIPFYFGHCTSSEKCKKAHEVPAWLSMRFCIYHLRIGGCSKGPGACHYPHRMGLEVANEYRSKVEAAKRGCPKCVEAAKATAAGKAGQKRKAESPEAGGVEERGCKKQKVDHNIVLVKNTALKFTEDNVPIEVECQIVGLGDRRLAGKIMTEQVSRVHDVKWGEKNQLWVARFCPYLLVH